MVTVVSAVAVWAGFFGPGFAELLPDRGPSDAEVLATPLSAEALTWLDRNAAANTRVVATPQMQKQISHSLRQLSVGGYESAAARPVDLLVVPPGYRTVDFKALQQLVARSEPLAIFWDGSQVRHILTRTPPSAADAARQQVGRQLLGESGIRLAPHAWASLAGGDVDPRLMSLLARVAAVHRVDISGFPRSGPERAARAPAREMLITAVDGRLASDSEAVAVELRSMMLALPPAFRPAEVRLPSASSPPGVLVRFLLPSASQLAPAGVPSKATP